MFLGEIRKRYRGNAYDWDEGYGPVRLVLIPGNLSQTGLRSITSLVFVKARSSNSGVRVGCIYDFSCKKRG